ncbi:MAG: hypothetical protein IPI67_17995 [Myxococcales bacterium]|nr:hypothetical protein [Myxococcales bacterium]
MRSRPWSWLVGAAVASACAGGATERTGATAPDETPPLGPSQVPAPAAPTPPAPPSEPDAESAPVPDAGFASRPLTGAASDSGAREDGGAEKPKTKLAFHPPGRCVDTEADVKRRHRALGQSAPGGASEPSLRLSADLDADGQEDEFFDGGVWNTTHRTYVYVRRGKCGHFLGEIVTRAGLGPLETSHRGLLDLGGGWSCVVQCCESVRYEQWRFDGRRYRHAKTSYEERDCSSHGGI